VLLNIGHDGDMAEIGNGFSTCRHNKVEANRVFDGGPWRVVVASRLWQKN